MISLLLTLFISLFSVGSYIYPVVDHQENIVYLQESKPVNNIGYVNVEGVQVYFTNVDLQNGDFYVALLNNLPSYTNLSLYSQSNGDYYFYNLNASFHSVVSAHVSETVLYNIGTVHIQKTRVDNYTYENVPYLCPYYTLDFLNNNDIILRINLIFSVPFLDEDALNTGISCVYMNFNAYHLSGDYCYVEDTNNNGKTLFYQYGYIPYRYPEGTMEDVYNDGYNVGYGDGRSAGYQEGYNTAFKDFDSYDDTALTIFEGIFNVGLLPVNVFLTIFNFELFGVNIAGIVSGLLTLSIVIIIIRFLLGGKKDD